MNNMNVDIASVNNHNCVVWQPKTWNMFLLFLDDEFI